MKLITSLSIVMMIVFVSLQAKTIHDNKKENTVTLVTPQELLKSKKWNIQGKSVELYFEYTDSKELLYIDGTLVSENKYYISDTNCFQQAFNASKVGQVNSGRFLITENSCYYITVINESTVQISYLSHDNPTTTILIAKP